jgi:hypothetical protein
MEHEPLEEKNMYHHKKIQKKKNVIGYNIFTNLHQQLII